MSIEVEIDMSNTCVAVYTPEVVSQIGIEHVIQRCKEFGSTLALEVWVPSGSFHTELPMMLRLGFNIAGTATKAEKVFVKFRLPIHSAGDGQPAAQLAVTATPIPPSAAEESAVALMFARYGRKDD